MQQHVTHVSSNKKSPHLHGCMHAKKITVGFSVSGAMSRVKFEHVYYCHVKSFISICNRY